MKKICKILAAFCIIPMCVAAQEEPMETDRPGEALGVGTVLKHHFQLETGFRREHDNENRHRHDAYLYPSALLKYGFLKNLDARILIEEETDYDYAPQKHKTAGGIEPVKASVKYHFFEGKGWLPSMSVIAQASVPKLASHDFKGEFIAPLIRLAMENEITKKFSLLYNAGEEWDDDDVHGSFFYSICPEYEISEKLTMFAEVYGNISREKPSQNGIDAGFQYLVKPNLQLDLSAGEGISKASADNFIELGFSFRLPR